MTMAIMPAIVLTTVSLLVNITLAVMGVMSGAGIAFAAVSLLESLLGMYLMLFVIGAVTTATECTNIRATTAQKLRAVFTFPLFMFTYLPVSFAALFMKVEWKPIHHTVTARELTHI